MQYTKYLSSFANFEAISKIHKEKKQWVDQDKKGFRRYRNPYLSLTKFPARHVCCNGDTVMIGEKSEVCSEDRQYIYNALKSFMPWRKGPFSVFGIDIDAEWRSNVKWDILQSHLPDLRGQVIADIGCNNGYYMFRMAHYQPKFVLGFEPSVQHYYCFKGLNSMAGYDNLDIDLLGVEHLSLFTECFDTVFLMGIIYHRPSPIDTLRDIFTALKPGGTLILETQGILGNEPVALFPDKTYAKVPGTYFVPTKSCLYNWIQKAGFCEIDIFGEHPMSSKIQRRTNWMEFESFSDYLDPNNESKTVEGYPAPLRFFACATKKR